MTRRPDAGRPGRDRGPGDDPRHARGAIPVTLANGCRPRSRPPCGRGTPFVATCCGWPRTRSTTPRRPQREPLSDDEVAVAARARGQDPPRVGRGVPERRPRGPRAKEEAEIAIIAEFLPAAADRGRAPRLVDEAIAATGATSPATSARSWAGSPAHTRPRRRQGRFPAWSRRRSPRPIFRPRPAARLTDMLAKRSADTTTVDFTRRDAGRFLAASLLLIAVLGGAGLDIVAARAEPERGPAGDV